MADPALVAHCRACTNSKCSCRTFFKNFDRWAEKLPLHPIIPEETWLWFKFLGQGHDQFISWSCVACEASPHASGHFTSKFARSTPEKIQLSNLLEHHVSPCHQKAIAEQFHLEVDPQYTVPKASMFKELLQAFQKGGSMTGGFALKSGHATYEKAYNALWCCNEGLNEKRRENITSSDCVCLMRDERRSRMHIRYRCGNESSPHKSGFFGQSRGHKSDSIGIVDATCQIFRQVCTKYFNPPKDSALAPEFDQECFDRVRSRTEAVSVDCAENEIVSIKDISLSIGGRPPVLTRDPHILRDSPHSGRRVLSRLWKADPVMDNCFGFFCHWPESPGQLIHFSDDFRRIYAECTAESECCAVSTQFSHLRAAKHRIETYLTPLSRCCLDPDALLGFAQKVSILRKGTSQGKSMNNFLSIVTGALFLLLGMMTEGAVLAMELIRFLDTEGVEIADICEKVNNFLDHITWLYFDDGALKVGGHTSFIIQWYTSKVHHFMADGKGRAFGGQPFPRSVIDDALKHLQAWVHLAKHCMAAEFPSFGIVNAFSCFALPRSPTIRVDAFLTPDVIDKINRLASTFKKPNLLQEVRTYFPFALQAYASSGFLCGYFDAWRKAMSMKRSQSTSLSYVVCRGDVYAPVTSGVEQSFSKVDAILGKNRLGATSETESMMVALLVAKFSDDELDDLIARAQVIWGKAFKKHSRMSVVHRSDKGVLRGGDHNSSVKVDAQGRVNEKQFLKRLRADVAASAPKGSASNLASTSPTLWQAEHESELQFQLAKRQKRLVEVRPHLN